MKPNVCETFAATALYVVLVLASVFTGQPDLAGFATLTLVPLGLLLGVHPELPLKEKLQSLGWFWYLLPLVGSTIWTINHPGHPIAFLVGTLCVMIFSLSAAFLIELYWIERAKLGRELQPEDGSSGLHRMS